ncbi:PLP-dependent aminotransferase family protein [Clostridium sp. BJN0001]|uniref:aminotransferase-like domain-containing protein n=1 Tax=Clostridium sp. BJN0001 TaxID=2930219 RepID=UPI001FD05C6D|nr:PLP-dependent aminotransferase family protein [Clostridium sp. BJN0001]
MKIALRIYSGIKFKEEVPKYIQIASFIKCLIDKKTIEEGDKLPTIRDLSEVIGVNKITIVNAYKKLKSDGYAYQRVGSGTYAKRKDISSDFSREYSNILNNVNNMTDDENIVDFTGETVSENFFPIDDLKDIINKVLERDGAKALISQNKRGYDKLIDTLDENFWYNKINTDNMLIISGAQQGIDIASKSILNINDNIIVENPTYIGALSVFKWRKVNLFQVPMKEDGIDIDKFEKVLMKNKITAFYTMSYFQNPTGISYSIEKKKRIIELSNIYNFYIIEDDYLSELIYDNSLNYVSFKSLDKYDRVIYLKSFSKIFLPGIRLGYLIAPDNLRDTIQSSKLNTDIATSSLMQRALEEYISCGKWIENIRNMNSEYSKRYKLIKKILDTDFKELLEYIDPKGGLSFYIICKEKSLDTVELFRLLKEEDILITPGILFFPVSTGGKNSFKISFYQTNEQQIKRGLKFIKKELEKLI